MERNTILIVDDEEDVVSALKFRLAMSGCEVLTAANGAQALEILREKTVNLVLADFMMPELNGLELTRLVKAHPKWFETKVLLFSCNIEPQYRQRAMELGAVDYLPKTDGANAIVNRVYEILEIDEPGGCAGAGRRRGQPRRAAQPGAKSDRRAAPGRHAGRTAVGDAICARFSPAYRRRHPQPGRPCC